MEVSMAHLPGWVIAVDYIMGLIMWTLIGRNTPLNKIIVRCRSVEKRFVGGH